MTLLPCVQCVLHCQLAVSSAVGLVRICPVLGPVKQCVYKSALPTFLRQKGIDLLQKCLDKFLKSGTS